MTATMNGNTPKSSGDEVKKTAPFSFGLFLIKLVVVLCDILTFPFYYAYQKPWKVLAKAHRVRAELENPSDPYSAYKRVGPMFTDHYAFKAETIHESQQLTFKLNPKDMPLLGRRIIKNVFKEKSSTGKTMLKYDLSDYEWVTNGEIDQMIGDLARGFLANGVKYHDRVLIFSETRMEWFLAAQALFRIGATVCTLYATLGQDGIVHGINETEVEHIFTTEDLLPSLHKIIERVPRVRKIYYVKLHPGLLKTSPVAQADFELSGRKVELSTYDQLRELGHSASDDQFEQSRPVPDDVAVILYTSGSTGNPKGVVLTHRNFLTVMKSMWSHIDEEVWEDYQKHIYFGIMPLAHSLELAAEMVMFGVGVRIGYGTTFTMIDRGSAIIKGQKGDLSLLQPTLMAGVPLILDRIRKTITDIFERKSNFTRQLFKYFCAYKNFWLDKGFDTPLVNRFICAPLNKKFGGRLEIMIIGGAPLSPETQRVMRAFLNIKLFIGYGATETCGPAMVMDLADLSVGRIGGPLPGVKVRLVDWPEAGYFATDKPHPRGELVVGGALISKEYFKLPDKTAEVYEVKDGIHWFQMGDIGEVHEDGTFQIIDRKKDLVKLQSGEYISLGKVESELKGCTYVDNVCVYGDSMHTYVIALILPNLESLKWLAKELKKEHLSVEQMCDDEEILANVLKAIRQFCVELGMNKMEIPQKIKLSSYEWSVKNGLLTASMKINRRKVQEHFKADIRKMYT